MQCCVLTNIHRRMLLHSVSMTYCILTLNLEDIQLFHWGWLTNVRITVALHHHWWHIQQCSDIFSALYWPFCGWSASGTDIDSRTNIFLICSASLRRVTNWLLMILPQSELEILCQSLCFMPATKAISRWIMSRQNVETRWLQDD